MPRTSDLSRMSLQQIEQVLERRRRQLARLERERAALARKVAGIDERIRRIGGRPGQMAAAPGRGGRPRNVRSLADTIEEILTKSGKPMRVSDITEAVQRTGYTSTSPNFRAIVNQMLIKDKRFAAAGRGSYQLKK